MRATRQRCKNTSRRASSVFDAEEPLARSGVKTSSRGESSGPGRRRVERSSSNARTSPDCGVPGASKPRSLPIRTSLATRATTRPRPSTSPCAKTDVQASSTSRRPGTGSPRNAARSSAIRWASRISAGPHGWPQVRIPAANWVSKPATASSKADTLLPWSSTARCHRGSRMPDG